MPSISMFFINHLFCKHVQNKLLLVIFCMLYYWKPAGQSSMVTTSNPFNILFLTILCFELTFHWYLLVILFWCLDQFRIQYLPYGSSHMSGTQFFFFHTVIYTAAPLICPHQFCCAYLLQLIHQSHCIKTLIFLLCLF